MWTQERSELTLERIKSMVIIKFNTSQSCIEFYDSIKENAPVLEAIKSGEKYKKAKVSGLSKTPLELNTEMNDLISCCNDAEPAENDD